MCTNRECVLTGGGTNPECVLTGSVYQPGVCASQECVLTRCVFGYARFPLIKIFTILETDDVILFDYFQAMNMDSLSFP